MRVIYRSASKRRLTPSTPTREFLNRVLSYLKEFFSRLAVVQSSLFRFYLHGLAWIVICSTVLPWVGPILLTLWFWRNRAVPWLFKRLSAPGDLPETSIKVRGIGSGLHHMVLKFEGPLNLKLITEKLERIVQQTDSWKLRRRLVCLSPGCWAWRRNEEFKVENHITMCQEGPILNCKTLKYKTNELCGVPVDAKLSPWHVHIVPYLKRETRAPCYALLVRAHHLIAHLFRAEDFYAQDNEERHLRDAIVYALSHSETSKRHLKGHHQNKACSKIEHGRFWSFLRLLWMAPALIIHEMFCCLRHCIKHRKTIGSKAKRALSWSDSISNDLVRRLKEASNAESEDAVLLSCLSGALHHYSRVSGNQEIGGESMRALVPRGNGFVRVTMPIGESCSMGRLRRVQNSLRRGRSDVKYKVSCVVAALWSWVLPSSVGSYLASLFCLRYPAVVNNFRVQASDNSILEVNYWKLPAVDVGLSLTFVHYGDQISLSVVSNFETLQRPDLLTSCFGRAVVDMALTYNVRYERKPSPPSTPIKILTGRFE